jgi:hypothetical protein
MMNDFGFMNVLHGQTKSTKESLGLWLCHWGILLEQEIEEILSLNIVEDEAQVALVFKRIQ